MSSGWVSIHRKLNDHWLWTDKPFSYGQAWIDMIMMCNHTENQFMIKHQMKHCERGTFYRSVRGLSEKWGWSPKKTRHFLKHLIDDEMIEIKPDKSGTKIRIINYNKYQNNYSMERTNAKKESVREENTF